MGPDGRRPATASGCLTVISWNTDDLLTSYHRNQTRRQGHLRRRTVAAVTCILLMAGLCSVPSGLAAAAPANEAPTSHGIVLGIEGSAFTINGKKTFLLGASYYGALAAPDDFIARDLDDLKTLGCQLDPCLCCLGRVRQQRLCGGYGRQGPRTVPFQAQGRRRRGREAGDGGGRDAGKDALPAHSGSALTGGGDPGRCARGLSQRLLRSGQRA